MMETEQDFANCMKVVEEAKNRVALEDKEEKRRALSSGLKVCGDFISFIIIIHIYQTLFILP
jgi:hypothetical protein